MAVVGTILLTEVVEQEGDQFAVQCPELGIASCGDSIEEAFANIREAIALHLNVLEELGDRERVFRERGIEISYEVVDVGEPHLTSRFTRMSRHQVPVLV